jgi:hypothetical protein
MYEVGNLIHAPSASRFPRRPLSGNSLLQEPLIDYGAVKRAFRALPLLADEQAYLLGQFSSVVAISHEKRINREGMWSNL